MKVKYQGGSVDIGLILIKVIIDLGNGVVFYNYDNSFGYEIMDINMDGKMKYQGSGNDLSYIFINMLFNYGFNVGNLYNYDLFLEQLL